VDVGSNGSMAYLAYDDRPGEMAWLDRRGRETGVVARNDGLFFSALLSPRGDRLAANYFGRDGEASLWSFDLATGARLRLSPAEAKVRQAAWSRDGKELVTLAFTGGSGEIVAIDAESGRSRVLVPNLGKRWIDVSDVSADGRWIVTAERSQRGDADIRMFELGGATPRDAAYRAMPSDEFGGKLSPDGRWIAYASMASGTKEIFVDSFPTPGEARRVTSDLPVLGKWWTERSSELMFVVQDRGRMAVISRQVKTTPALEIGAPERLYELPSSAIDWTVGSDGQRAIVQRRVGPAMPALTYVTNWSGGGDR
jgi:dipeptidyl aminopeptidase/acylaminoacyl peptidase